MNYKRSTITHATTGTKVWAVGFDALEFELRIAPAPGSALSSVHESKGVTDFTNQVCDTFSVESTRFQRRFTDRSASIWEWNGTAWAEVFSINNITKTATDISYDVTVGNSSYQVHRIARG